MRKSIILVLLVLFFIGCVKGTGVLMDLSLGMNKSQVIHTMGKPKAVRGSIRNKYNQVVEVWEYRLDPRGTIGGMAKSFEQEQETYWLYFCNGELVQWNKAGDWQVAADKIYEIRFR